MAYVGTSNRTVLLVAYFSRLIGKVVLTEGK